MKKIICLVMIGALCFGLAGCSSQKESQSEKIIDYSQYFNGINGAAVFYDDQNDTYNIYNKEICEKQSSPCSTFKIISTLMGLKYEVILSADSKMNYNDVSNYPVEAWNEDLTLKDAFQKSCIWYFRQVIDIVGKEVVQRELANLQYGNCDISEWEGSNTNPLPDLNGFWLDSSLKISPIEQVDIVQDIFEGNTEFSAEHIALLKNLMLVQDCSGVRIYGKTGSGVCGNAWFVGFCERESRRYYFAVYLEDQKGEVSGAVAKGIALKIAADILK